jgi:Protein of unknown function (DUF3306)
MSRANSWANRKAGVEAERREEALAAANAEIEAREAEQADKTDEEVLEELGLPEPETLEKGADFKVFLTETVPARIRTRALRRLWITNPILANVDGLVDYGEDFTDASCVIENLQTAYQVGKGMTAHVDELARQAEEELQALQNEPLDEELVEDDVIATSPTDDLTEDEAEPVSEPTPTQPHNALEPEDEVAPVQSAPRRMRFVFDEAGQGA